MTLTTGSAMLRASTFGDVIGDGATRVLLSVTYRGRATVNDVMRSTGLSRTVVWKHLRELERRKLVSWPPGTQGTLRALCYEVPK